jgi:hypothetical protein
MSCSRRAAFAFLACFWAIAEPVRASTVIFRTDAQLVALSERVVHGRVVGQRTTRGGPQGLRIYTVTTLQIVEDLTGVDGDTVEVWELGGVLGDEFLYVGGAVQYRIGEEVLVMLERGPQGLRSVAMGFSTFDVLPEINGERRLRRNLRDTVVVGGAVSREPSLSELRSLTTNVTGRPSRLGRAPRVGEELQSVEQPFTLLGGSPGWRWIQADSATPVTWYKNTSAPNPLVSGDAVSEIQTSLGAWTTPASASIILQYGGTTVQSVPEGPWTGLPAASAVITFEDPDNEISGSVLAIGGGNGFGGGAGGTVNGVAFNGFSRGYVIFQNAADLSPSFRQSLNFTRVLTHEIGHAIGLGHTQTDGSVANATSNIMYPSCCAAATPTPPAIGPDDLAGLNFIYPSGPPPSCTYSINPTSAPASEGSSSGSLSVATQAGCAWTAASNTAFLGISSGSVGSGSGSVGYTVAANPTGLTRSGTLTVAGRTFTVNQAAAPCSYAITPESAIAPAAGGNASAIVTATSGCSWTAASNSGFIGITSSPSGSGTATVTYSVAANGVSARSGTLTIAGQTLTVSQFGTGPMVTLDRTSLRYGATLSGATVTAQTAAQVVRLTQTSGTAVTWTATASQPWLQVSPASGSGGRELSITVNPAGLSPSTSVSGTVTIALTGAGNAAGPISVTLVTMPAGTSVNPVGVIDTPTNNTTGVTGAIPVTGWALDDVDVANIFVCRAPVAGEAAAADGRCGGLPQVYVGEAVFIDDARPDVQAAYATLPRNYRGGWGFMVLTNMLPNQGNGPYTFYVHAVDREGHSLALGSRNITCANASATLPFGTIDTPGQGETVAGAAYVNFGWALTQAGKFIPFDGSTITVFVDGASVGTASYNHNRADIAGLFPGLANSNGAIGFRTIDTTALANGLHMVVWTVTDSAGATAGLGSRYFRVSNGVSAPAVLTEGVLASGAVATTAVDPAPIVARRGWDPAAPWRAYAVGQSGRAVIRGEELDRFEVWLRAEPGARYTGSLRAGGALAALPAGSQLDPASGIFTWSPGLGFVGTYDLVFVRWVGDRAVAQHNVRVILRPKSSGHVGTQVEIDSPRSQQDIAQPFNIVGWAADLDAAAGTGIDTLHAWAYPLAGGPPVFLGVPATGGVRPDVAAVHGDQFRDTGYWLAVQGLPHGNYDIAVFPWSNVSGAFAPPKIVQVTVR